MITSRWQRAFIESGSAHDERIRRAVRPPGAIGIDRCSVGLIAEPVLGGRLTRVALAVVVSLTHASREAVADVPFVDVGADQRVTVEGASPSLKTLIEDLCWRAGVELMSFDAEDRPVTIKATETPFHTVLARLLKAESFVVGYRGGAEGVRVAWLRVLGSNTTAMANRASGSVKTAVFQPPPALVESAFSANDAEEQKASLESLSARITGDPVQLRQFLATQSSQMVPVLRQYPRSAELLQQLRATQSDPAIVAKLDELIGELNRADPGP